jgi:hypothetical protein
MNALQYLSLVLIAGTVHAQTIPNPLGLNWPWELTRLKTNATGSLSVRIGDELRPAQADGSNVWFIATLKGKDPVPVTLTNIATTSPLTVQRSGKQLVIANGVYEINVPFGPFRVAGDSAWYGAWKFEQDLPVETEIIAQGPVFVTVRIHAGTVYDATWRFVMGDPWIDVLERYDLPAPNALELDLLPGLRPDLVIWTPWFAHDGFKPVGRTLTHPLQKQEKQGGRPFVMMRPRWNQQPGSGQDFFVTRTASNAPAVGVIATYPIRWIEPYAQTINAYAENGDTARLKFPLKTGQRAWALCIGPKDNFDSYDKLNCLVRRHTDWTLDKQWHEYILEWPRDPAKAGPHILITREELARLQREFQAGTNPVLQEFAAKRDQLKGPDKDLFALIAGEKVKRPNPPGAELWIQRRYQDDFLNPTTHSRKIKGAFPLADLLAGGEPLGGPWQAALGYVFTDLNHWPGWHNGWSPGNPNFHTDKYMVATFAGAALLDHPHAKQWLDFGHENFVEDLKKVFLEPDGVGYECPGYAGYSMGLQLEGARVFHNVGYGNLVAANPLWKKNLTWHRHLLTPFDVRLGLRHEAPLGDTHRWTAGGVDKAGAVAKFYQAADPAFASEMMAVWKLLREQGQRGSLLEDVVHVDQTIPAAPLDQLDWGSHAFAGFGAILRTGFGTPQETFVSFKAGSAQGHYHNDELSYHFYGAGTPLSLDYNCSYHPRGDHAALHNSMTFGYAAPVKAAGDEKAVPAQEQLFGAARVLAFTNTPAADLVVAERTGHRLALTPLEPNDTRFGYEYPSRSVPPITHRRHLVLVKHAGGPLADYLVLRDETNSTEPQQLNIHLLARDVHREGPLIRAAGQWDTDALVFLAQITEKQFEVRHWYYYDEWMNGPGQYKKKGDVESEAANAAWLKKIQDTHGAALIPPVGWKDKWLVGEYQKWLRLETAPGTPTLWVLYPQKHGTAAPQFQVDGAIVRVTLGNAVDEILLTGTEARVNQTGLVSAGQLPPLAAGATRAPLGRDEAHPD